MSSSVTSSRTIGPRPPRRSAISKSCRRGSRTYHGITLKEMDVDAVIARKPTVALVDELAHTNAPDSKNRKRYEDVEDLLRAGINVISTVNIQHLESLYNFVEQCDRRAGEGARPRRSPDQGRPDRDHRSAGRGFAGAIAGRENLSQRNASKPRSRISSPRRISPACAK